MPKAEKVATVAEITDRFRSSSAAVVTEYRGLTMAQLTELRRSLGKDTAYTVAKNTLVKRAAADAGIAGLDDLFVGPTAVAFIAGEPVEAAKALRDFAKSHPLLVIKGGLLDGRKLEPAEVSKLADLESREVLLGKMAGAMLATLTKAAVVLNALPSQVARLAAALQEKRVEAGETLEVAAVAEVAIAEAAADEVAAIEEAAAEVVVAVAVEEAAVIEAAAEDVAVIEEIADAAVAEELDAGDVEAAEAVVVEAAAAEEAVIEEAAEEIAVLDEVAEEVVEEAAAEEEAIIEEAVADVVVIEAVAEEVAAEIDDEPGNTKPGNTKDAAPEA
jgi:large subunit ribosomal protein L10